MYFGDHLFVDSDADYFSVDSEDQCVRDMVKEKFKKETGSEIDGEKLEELAELVAEKYNEFLNDIHLYSELQEFDEFFDDADLDYFCNLDEFRPDIVEKLKEELGE